MPTHLTVLGSINMDLVVYTERLPAAGETLLGASFQTFPGGKGANQAVAAARMGANVRMLGKVGSDTFGEELLDNLLANNVETRLVSRGGAASGTALITVDAGGRNTIVVVPGANGEVLPVDLSGWGDALTKADGLLMQLEIPLETVLAAAQLAHLAGVLVILNPAPAQPLPPELLQLVDVMVLNETETALISGQDVSTSARMEEAARKLLDAGVGWVVITLGEQGVLAVSPKETLRVPAYPVTAVDTVAAGDAFTGALAVALADEAASREPPEGVRKGRASALASSVQASSARVLQLANAAGALAVTVRGAQPSLPTRQMVVDFLRSR